MTGQSGVVHLGNLRMLAEEVDHLQGVLYVALYAQAQGLYTLQEDKGVEGRDGGTSVTQQDGTDAGDVSCSTYSVGKDDAVVAPRNLVAE